MHFFLMTFSITLQNYNPKGRNVVKMGYKMILFKKHVTTLEVFTTKKTKIYLNPHYALDSQRNSEIQERQVYEKII